MIFRKIRYTHPRKPYAAKVIDCCRNRMRLTKQQTITILQSVSRLAGIGAIVYLLGSRLNDQSKGGDIDLLIESDKLESSPTDNDIRKVVRNFLNWLSSAEQKLALIRKQTVCNLRVIVQR